jgi:HD domain
MYEKYRNRYRVPAASARVRQQIAREAARRLYARLVPRGEEPAQDWLDAASNDELYTAKRKAAAVLGHRIRPGDLPSDSEVREQLIALRSAADPALELAIDESGPPEPDTEHAPLSFADHLDRFAIFKMRLQPLESVKQNPKYHPEGDALYHSLQVFHLAREARPYDEEFLLAALLHDVGKAIDPQDHVKAGVEAVRGAVTARTLWLIEHHMDLLASRDRALPARIKRELEGSEYYDDLVLLREVDDAGRIPGEHVDTLDEVLGYLKGLEEESYLS